MKCPKCEAVGLPNERFCKKCGTEFTSNSTILTAKGDILIFKVYCI